VDEKSRVLLVVTLGSQMAKKTLKTHDNNNGIQKSTQIKYHVQKFTYDGFIIHYYTYMVKVIQEVGNLKWDNAMDEEMVTLDTNGHWELVSLLKDKKAMGCKWVY